MPELDIKTLLWVLQKDAELQHKIWDLREEIQDEIQKQLDKKQSYVKEEINIHG